MTATDLNRPSFPKRAVITAGMPYGNKGLHFGHIGGVFVPADFLARFLRDRIGAENVLFVSGTDCYGSPIAEGYRKKVEAGFEGTIVDYVMENHTAQEDALKAYGISLNIYAGSALPPAADFHNKVSEHIIERLYEVGALTKRSTPQFYDTEAQTFLNGRQVIGRCPVRGCKSEKAYADECDLGHQFDPQDLISPVSQLTGTRPELRPAVNWYFDLPEYKDFLESMVAYWNDDDQVRPIVPKTVQESLEAPLIYIKNEEREALEALADKLPRFVEHPAEGNQTSFSVEFEDWKARDEARDVLEAANIRFRTGKTLLPFRITGNIEWGIPAPEIEGVDKLTVWVWPESLWAPISFVQTVLATDTEREYSSRDWRDWWCDEDAQVFQFIGQDNIYFYCVAQPAMFDALDEGLKQTTPVANHHILFMNKKASSSGAIKPPMAAELLDYYTPEQLRAHWLSLGLDQKAVSFSPKAFDTSVSYKDKKTGAEVMVKDDPRVADPALKESAFLTNIFNRLARSCFYGAQKRNGGKIPALEPSAEAVERCRAATLAFERAAHDTDIHGALAIAEDFGRDANKAWDAASKAAGDDDAAYIRALADAMQYLRTLTLLMHPVAPDGCEKIVSYLNIDERKFFSWEYAFTTLPELLEVQGTDSASHQMVELPPRTDFFRAHESQFKKK